MQLHQIRPFHRRKDGKRIGRGGKRGTYSGRGQKGQRARAGHRIRPASRDTIQRLPKLRGFKFKPIKQKPVVLNLGDLDKKIKGDIIDRKALFAAGLIKKSDTRVKILGKGEIKKVLKFSGLEVSSGAKQKIERVGGNITQHKT